MKKNNVFELVGISTLLAITVILQSISPYLRIGPIPITLTLIPVVVGGILFGVKGGSILGLSFGIVVVLQCITGIDPGGAILYGVNPIMTVLLCLLKGSLAGYVSAIVYKCFKNKGLVAVLCATMLAPVVNTSIFLLGMFTFFNDTLHEWSGGENVLIYTIVTLVGVNFLVEFLINSILSPVVLRVIKVIDKSSE